MTQMERELFDLHVYGTTQPHIDGKKEIKKESHFLAWEQEETVVREFAKRILALNDDFCFNHTDPTRAERDSFLREMLELVSAELGDTAQFARDIKEKMKDPDISSDYCDDIIRIKNAFDLQ